MDTLHNRRSSTPATNPTPRRASTAACTSFVATPICPEYATALKIGTTSLVLQLLEDGLRPPLKLADPIRAVKQVSRDITLKLPLELQAAPHKTAIEVQRVYQQEAESRLRGQDEDTDWTLTEWAATLDALETDPFSLSDRLDWAAKYRLLNEYREAEGLQWDNPTLQSFDLEYHNIDPEMGLYYGLEQEGAMRRLVTDARINAAISCPPSDTRAFIRGLFVERFAGAIRTIGWNGIAFCHNGEDFLFDMNPLVEANVGLLNEEFAAAHTLDDFVAVMQRKE